MSLKEHHVQLIVGVVGFGYALIFTSPAVSQSVISQIAQTIERADRNTLVIHGNVPGLGKLEIEGHIDIITNQSRSTTVLRGSPAMTDNREQQLRNPDLQGLIVQAKAEAQPGQFPWEVALVDSAYADAYVGQFCAGALISERWVATAAHCVYQSYAKNFTVPIASVDIVAGRVQLNSSQPRIKLRQIIIHEKWRRGDHYIPFDNDIALLELRDPVMTGDTVRPTPYVKAQDGMDLVSMDTILRVAGWGMTKAGDTTTKSRTLLWTDVKVLENSKCMQLPGYGQQLTGNMFCASLAASGACQGDSGGGIINRETTPATLVGIVSWAPHTCTFDKEPAVYTRLSVFAPWITQNASVTAVSQR